MPAELAAPAAGLTAPIATVLSAAIAALVGGFGGHLLTWRRERQKARDEAKLQHLQRQIEELYGPVTGLCVAFGAAIYIIGGAAAVASSGPILALALSAADDMDSELEAAAQELRRSGEVIICWHPKRGGGLVYAETVQLPGSGEPPALTDGELAALRSLELLISRKHT